MFTLFADWHAILIKKVAIRNVLLRGKTHVKQCRDDSNQKMKCVLEHVKSEENRTKVRKTQRPFVISKRERENHNHTFFQIILKS